MSPALLAHQRLFPTIPRERIHTHEQRPAVDLYPGRPSVEETLSRRATIKRLTGAINPATGKKWRGWEIAAQLDISLTAVRHHQRVLRGGEYRHKRKR